MHTPHVASGGRYPVLRALAILQVISAFLIAVGGVVTAAYMARWAVGGDKAIVILGILSGAFFATILTLAFAELLKLMIDVEHNTRVAARAAMAAAEAAATAVPSDAAAVAVTTHVPGADGGHVNRITPLVPNSPVTTDDETAEGALFRGH